MQAPQTALASGTTNLFAPVIPASQADPTKVVPILKAHEDQTKKRIPSMFSDMVSAIGSPTKLLNDYANTGDEKLKQASGNAMTALTNLASKSKTMFTPPAEPPSLLGNQAQVEQSSNPLFYNRTEQIQDTVPKVVPQQYKDAIYDTANKYGVSTDTLGQILQKESQGNPMAIHRNKDGSIDQGLMQINSTNMKQVQQHFQFTGRHFDPFNANDSIEAAAYLLKENASELKDKLGRSPTDQELYDSYNLGVAGLVKALQGNLEEKNLLQKYNVGTIFS